MRVSLTLLVFIIFSLHVHSQNRLTTDELNDLTERAMKNIELFMDYVEDIGSAKNSMESRKLGLDVCLRLFSSNAIIQTQNKDSSIKNEHTARNYLLRLLTKSEYKPRIITFEVIDDLNPDELTRVVNADGSISYKGSMVFRQYYCVLKDTNKRIEPTKNTPNVNCIYYDYTDKKVTVEYRLSESKTKGKFWITLISSILVQEVW